MKLVWGWGHLKKMAPFFLDLANDWVRSRCEFLNWLEEFLRASLRLFCLGLFAELFIDLREGSK